jgi:membrane-bound lytic murein transglycosylase MltF
MDLKSSWHIRATLVLFLVLSAAPARARTLAAIEADGRLRVGLTGDYAPYALRGPDGKTTVADVSVAQALAQNLGVGLEIVQLDLDNRTIFDVVAAGLADVMITDGAEVDYQARRHPGVLCAAAVPHAFDHFDKAYWMTRDPFLKAAVDAFLKQGIDTGDYQRELAAQAGKS